MIFCMISVVIPCYNYGHLIADTIRSVQQQTYTDWEMLIVDDGSTDNTAEVVQGFISQDNRIQFYQQQNAGPSAARNLALQKAKGDYIQFLDADDVLESSKFEVQLGVFGTKPFVDIVYGNVRYFSVDPDNRDEWKYTFWGQNKEWMPGITGKGNEILPVALKGSFAHISCFLFKREIIEKAGKWDVTKKAAEDYLFVLRCVLADGYFYYHNQPGSFALVRWHGNNTSRNIDWIHQEERRMRIELAPLIVQTGNEDAVLANENAIKALNFMTKRNWRSHLLSGGRFDFIKKVLRFVGIEKIVKNYFYR